MFLTRAVEILRSRFVVRKIQNVIGHSGMDARAIAVFERDPQVLQIMRMVQQQEDIVVQTGRKDDNLETQIQEAKGRLSKAQFLALLSLEEKSIEESLIHLG